MYLDLLAKIAPTSKMGISEILGVIISGLAIVFLVLIILVFSVNCFGVIFEKQKKRNIAKQKSVSVQKPVVEKTATVQVPQQQKVISNETSEDEDEVIAVISAVIAQMSAEDGKQYKLKSVKARNSKSYGRPVWASEGIRQNTNPF